MVRRLHSLNGTSSAFNEIDSCTIDAIDTCDDQCSAASLSVTAAATATPFGTVASIAEVYTFPELFTSACKCHTCSAPSSSDHRLLEAYKRRTAAEDFTNREQAVDFLDGGRRKFSGSSQRGRKLTSSVHRQHPQIDAHAKLAIIEDWPWGNRNDELSSEATKVLVRTWQVVQATKRRVKPALPLYGSRHLRSREPGIGRLACLSTAAVNGEKWPRAHLDEAV